MYPKTLQYLMGHSDIGVTMNTYTHLGLEDAVEELRLRKRPVFYCPERAEYGILNRKNGAVFKAMRLVMIKILFICHGNSD